MAWLSGWSYRKEITVQAANVDAALSDFPCLVKVSNDADLAAALATGYDVRFTQSDGETLLKHETESWSGGGGSNVTAEWWVKVPSISSTTGATLYIYYGKAGASTGDDATNVWDANFGGVWHLGESSGSAADSTGNQNGTFEGDLPDQQTGKVGNCQNFDGSGDAVNLGSGTYQYANGFTMECLFKGGSGSTYEAFLCAGNTRSFFGRNAGNLIYLHYSPTSSLVTGSAVNDNAWHHCLVTKSASTGVRLYLDGAYDTGNASYTGTVNYSTYTGVDTALGIDEDGDQWSLNGYLDEFRISDVVRSDAWIKFTKANIFEADNELTWGSEEDAVALGDDSFENASPFENDEEIGTAEATGGSTPYSYAITSQNQTAGNEVLEVTGTLSPDATGTYVENGTYNSEPAYEREGGAYWIWYYGSTTWYLSTTKGTAGAAYWLYLGVSADGPYAPAGTATGTATVAGIEPFAIGSASGVITIDDNTDLAVGQEWEVVVEVTDDDSETDTGTFTIGLVAGGITGTASQTLPAITQAASGEVAISGAVSQTLPAVSQAAVGGVLVNGTASQTLPAITQSASGVVPVSGSAAQLLPALTQAAAGAIAVSGSIAQTLPAIAQAASGASEVTGAASQTLPALGQAASGTVSISGTASQTLRAITQTASGASSVTGAAAQTLPALAQAAAGSIPVAGVAAQTLPAITQAAAGTVPISGIASQTLPGLLQAAIGSIITVSGTAAQVLPSLTQSATGTTATPGMSRIAASGVWVPGAVSGQSYSAGTVAGQVYLAGTIAGQCA